MKNRKHLVAAMFTMLAFAVARADAGFTKINKPWAGEPSQQQVLAHLYGGTFVASGVDFSNGTVTATRVDDAPAGYWRLKIDSVTTVGRFTRNSETFGLVTGASGGSFKPLFTVKGRNFNVTGSITNNGSNGLPPAGSTYRLERSGGDGVALSLPKDNGGVDHLISYIISGSTITKPTSLLFFEDNSGGKPDFDFNDLVVKVTTAAVTAPPSSTAAIPVPLAMTMGALGMAMLVAGGVFRRVRQTVAAN